MYGTSLYIDPEMYWDVVFNSVLRHVIEIQQMDHLNGSCRGPLGNIAVRQTHHIVMKQIKVITI